MPNKEVELKLELAPASLPALKKVPLLRSPNSPPTHTREISVYFDTDKHKLRRKGLMLRVRRIGRRHVQTIKAAGNSAPFERDEWEAEIAGDEPDLSLAGGTALEPLVNGKLRRQLKPLFETRVRRTVYPIADDTRAIALTIDRGTIDTGSRSAPLCEVELELERGTIAELFDVARELTRAVPAHLAVKSKSERGYELIDDRQDAPVKAVPIDLPAAASTREAFQIIGRACLRQVVGNEPALIKGDPEGVHQMRVGLRRLRAAMSLFSGILRDAQTAAIKAELKWLTGELGPARELDVLVKRVVAPVQRQRARWDGMPSLSHELAEKREAALARAQDAAKSARFRTLTVEVAAWLEAGRVDQTAGRARSRPWQPFGCGFCRRAVDTPLAQGAQKRQGARAARRAQSTQAAHPGQEAALRSGILLQCVHKQAGRKTARAIPCRPRAPAGRPRRSQ